LVFELEDGTALHLPHFGRYHEVDHDELRELRDSLITALVGVEAELDKQGFFDPPPRYTLPDGAVNRG
jgi:hypothetical protein